METKDYKVGNYEVIALTEEESDGDINILLNAPQNILKQYAPDGTFPRAVRAYLIRKGDQISLFDTGFGRKIFDQMKALGISPSDVKHIYLTHMHGDHIGGLLKEGKPIFENADITISKKEIDYWTSEDEMKAAPDTKKGNFTLAKEVLKIYKDKLIIETPNPLLASENKEIQMLEAYGHTPGHVMYLVDGGEGAKLLIWGDVLHVLTVQIPHPEISVSYDILPDMAKKTRINVLDYVSSNNIPIAGMHVPYGGIGIVKKATQGYSFTSIEVK